MGASLNKLYHFSFPCRDGEETRVFYEDVLGLPMVACMSAEQVPSTGEFRPYAHFFFEMRDGSYLAFFDLGRNEIPEPSPNTPDWVMHFAIEMDSVDDVLAMRDKLKSAGVQTTDIVDHDFINSIYFFDPNGLRLEVTARVEKPGQLDEMRQTAHAELEKWSKRKAKLLAGA